MIGDDGIWKRSSRSKVDWDNAKKGEDLFWFTLQTYARKENYDIKFLYFEIDFSNICQRHVACNVIHCRQKNRQGEAQIPAVILPGFADGAPMYSLLVPELTRMGDLYLINPMGLGVPNEVRIKRTGSPEGIRNIFLAYYRGIFEYLGLSRFRLIGHGLGAYFAMFYALEHPTQIEHLCLLAPMAGLAPEAIKWQAFRSHVTNRALKKVVPLMPLFNQLHKWKVTPFDFVRVTHVFTRYLIKRRIRSLLSALERKPDILLDLLANYLYDVAKVRRPFEAAISICFGACLVRKENLQQIWAPIPKLLGCRILVVNVSFFFN